jgi:hypothetical protein
MHFLLKDELPVPYRRSLNISRNRLNDGRDLQSHPPRHSVATSPQSSVRVRMRNVV